ncbi:MAG: flagellar protein FlaG [Butyrivibrio sp.]|nr:flagellar protein FlaG [Butyrivibrio sp.]
MEAIRNVQAVNQAVQTKSPQRVDNVQKAERVVEFPSDNKPNISQDTTRDNNPKMPEKPESVSSKAENEEFVEQENARIKKAIQEMNKKMTNNSEAVFGIHEDTNRITIKIVDKETKEVIKELPPEKTLDMIAKAWELAGMMIDEKG